MGYSEWTHRWSILSFFITCCTGSSSTPKQYLFSLDSWKKFILGIHPKTISIPAPLPQQGFCTSLQIWDELGVTWQTKQIFFFATSRAIKFKHFKHLFMTLSGLGWLTMWELPPQVSYFASSLLQNYFSCFIQDFWSSPSFLAFKTSISPWSFYHPTFEFFQFF